MIIFYWFLSHIDHFYWFLSHIDHFYWFLSHINHFYWFLSHIDHFYWFLSHIDHFYNIFRSKTESWSLPTVHKDTKSRASPFWNFATNKHSDASDSCLNEECSIIERRMPGNVFFSNTALAPSAKGWTNHSNTVPSNSWKYNTDVSGNYRYNKFHITKNFIVCMHVCIDFKVMFWTPMGRLDFKI